MTAVLIAGGIAIPTAVTIEHDTAAAAAPVVVINEINYNPASDNPFDEYLEFRNNTGSAIDLGGWFVDGVNYRIPAGVVARAGGHAVIGGAMFGAFGALSNGGEELVLIDPSGAVVDTVEYDDHDEWPALADGEGHSLQRRDPAAPGDEPGNWVSDFPSPGAPNPLAGAGLLPSFSDVEHTVLPAPGAPITVTAELSGATTATLIHVIGLGGEQPIAMSVAGGVATATIPGQPAGSLVRYRLEASQGGLVGTWPRQGDGARYRGTTVARRAPSALPTFELFMPDDVYGVMANDLTLPSRSSNCAAARAAPRSSRSSQPEPWGPGFLQVLPCGTAPGATSNVNVDRPGATVAAVATVAFDAAGTACVFTSGPARIVADLQGYFKTGAFDDIADQRLLDSRQR